MILAYDLNKAEWWLIDGPNLYKWLNGWVNSISPLWAGDWWLGGINLRSEEAIAVESMTFGTAHPISVASDLTGLVPYEGKVWDYNKLARHQCMALCPGRAGFVSSLPVDGLRAIAPPLEVWEL